MKLEKYKEQYLDEVVKIWNEDVAATTIAAPLTKEEFHKKFMENPNYDNDGMLLAIEDGKVVGFGVAIYYKNEENKAKTPGYIPCIAVTKSFQRRGIGTAILKELEAYLKEQGKTYVRNFFASPINFAWYIPGYDRHIHGGMPAIEINSPFYFLLVNNGYIVNGEQDGYHLDLGPYELPEKVKKTIEIREQEGYTITFYDKDKHHGFEELFEALKTPGWYQSTLYNLKRENPYPMLIVQKDGEILGWTGSVYTESTGRGHLDGVGVHPKTQGLGLGKAMFSYLCYQSKVNGAKYMTLFTGSENPARNIYMYAGFRLAKSFAILRKELK